MERADCLSAELQMNYFFQPLRDVSPMPDAEEVLRTVLFTFAVLLWFALPYYLAPILGLLPPSLLVFVSVAVVWLGLPFFLALLRFHRKGYEVAGLSRLLD